MAIKHHQKVVFLIFATVPFLGSIGRLLHVHDNLVTRSITFQEDFPIEPRKRRPEESFSACLLFNDDTHFLIEWIAYHWKTLPLRRLVVAIDPLSNTNPSGVLKRWESLINISIWEDDYYFNRFLRSSILRSGSIMNDTSEVLVNLHRQRQKMFYLTCMQKLKDEGHSWTTFVDTDELVFFNERFRSKLSLQANTTVFGLLNRLEEVKQLSSPCVGLPRLLFGSKEDNEEGPFQVINANNHKSRLQEIGVSPNDFMTLRWRWHAGSNHRLNRAGKALVDVSRVPQDLFQLDNVNAHRPIKQLCNNDAMWISIDKSPLVLYHYVGTHEQWISRDDVRNKRTSRLYSEMAAVNQSKDDVDRTGWLLDFIKVMGEKNATLLLKDVGKVNESARGREPMSPEAKLAKLSSLLYGKKTRKKLPYP